MNERVGTTSGRFASLAGGATLVAFATAAGLTSGAVGAQDDPRVLTIASWAGPGHVVNADMWPAFVEQIEEASGGTLTAEVKLNLVPPPAMADLVLDGGADITFIFHGYNAGRFVVPQLVELPGVDGDAEATSAAYWRVWEEHLEAAGEQDEFKTLAMFLHGPAQLHMVEPMATLAELDGLKIRAPGGVGGIVIEALGGIGISVPATKVYETLSAGAADGVSINMDGRIGYNLDEVAPAMFLMPGGFYRGSFAALMNLDVWESLPPKLQVALDEQVLGEPMSRLFGKAWDASDAVALAQARELGSPIVEAGEDDIALFAPVIEKAADNVLEQVSGRGVDAATAQASFERHTADIMGDKGN